MLTELGSISPLPLFDWPFGCSFLSFHLVESHCIYNWHRKRLFSSTRSSANLLSSTGKLFDVSCLYLLNISRCWVFDGKWNYIRCILLLPVPSNQKSFQKYNQSMEKDTFSICHYLYIQKVFRFRIYF